MIGVVTLEHRCVVELELFPCIFHAMACVMVNSPSALLTRIWPLCGSMNLVVTGSGYRRGDGEKADRQVRNFAIVMLIGVWVLCVGLCELLCGIECFLVC